jgi:aryl-alcohol dehydrogenase-like predicted oxidoreductase
MSQTAAFRILDAAWALGVRAFDTAEAYGSSAERLRAWSRARGNAELFEVVTKCSVNPQQSLEALGESADKALSRFDGIGHLVLLTHGAVGADRWPVLLAASGRHNAAVGQSVYLPAEVRAACELPGVERLQVPGNILDHRAVPSRQDASVSLDVRSIYLQGVLLEDPQQAELRAPGSGKFVAAVHSAAAMLDTGLAPLLIASMLKTIRAGDRLVIGVDNVSELDSLPAAFEIPDDTVEEFQKRVGRLADDPALSTFLDPRSWTPPLAR